MNIKIDALNYYGATKKYHLHFPALRNVFICRRENWMRYWRC